MQPRRPHAFDPAESYPIVAVDKLLSRYGSSGWEGPRLQQSGTISKDAAP